MGHPQLRPIIPPRGMSQKEYDRRVRDLCWFAGGFMCALVAVSWLVVP